jgi:HSP20 family protein
MTFHDLLPWTHNRILPSRMESEGGSPASFEDRMERLFDDFVRDFWSMPDWRTLPTSTGMLVPYVDLVDGETAMTISVELPGMDEKDITLTVQSGNLTISGEKKALREEGKEESPYMFRERVYGTFRRTLPLPDGLDIDRALAVFRKGVLTVTIPKSKEVVESSHHIEIKGESSST